MNKLEEAAKAYQEKEQKLWEQSIQLDGLYAFDEAQERCPAGYRIPTRKEWCQFIVNTKYSFDKEKKEGVFRFADGFELRLPAAGLRYYDGRLIYGQGTRGYYWSSSLAGTIVTYVIFDGSKVEASIIDRVYAFSVRCVPIEIK